MFLAAAAAQADVVTQSLQALERSTGGALKVSRSADTGLVTFLASQPGHPIPLTAPAGASPESRAAAFLDAAGDAFGLADASQAKATHVSGVDEVGMEHVRFQQQHAGLPLRGAELTVHLRGNSVVAVNAKTLSGLGALDTTPSVPVAAASEAARAFVARVLERSGATFSRPRLEIVNPGLFLGRVSESHVAWFVEARAAALREFLWVDAHSGVVLFHFNQLPHAKVRSVYDSNNTDTLPGTLLRSEGDPAVGDADADGAYDLAGEAYDYFLNQHGRDSYDDLGSPLISSVRYCDSGGCPMENAFWDGTQMVYGEDFALADDVGVHELAHAVTEYTASLAYCAESGALNESYSDIFGESADLLNSMGDDSPGVRWDMGEDLPIGAVRDMLNPHDDGNPETVSDRNYACYVSCTESNDSGGVHGNSGVPNLAYVLMVDGGTFNGYTVTGIGLVKAGKIQYRALANYLTSTADFLDNFDAVNQSCADLIGTAGITSDDCVEVENAMKAVELDQPVCPAPSSCAATVDAPKLKVKGVLKDTGERSMSFSGSIVLPHPFSPVLDPSLNGVRVYIVDNLGAVIADDTVTDIPYDKDNKLGWKVGKDGTKWSWTDKNAYVSTISKLSIQDKSAKTPGLIKFKVSGKQGDYQVSGSVPVTATLILDRPAADGTGQCASASFTDPEQACEMSASGDGLSCK